jgi:hypothetical protein
MKKLFSWLQPKTQFFEVEIDCWPSSHHLVQALHLVWPMSKASPIISISMLYANDMELPHYIHLKNKLYNNKFGLESFHI